jgi:hypothetical protein
MERILKAYIYEAIEVEKAGLKVNFKKNTELPYLLKNCKTNLMKSLPRRNSDDDGGNGDGGHASMLVRKRSHLKIRVDTSAR